MCYWPLLFKKGGLKFWLAFTEKFGSAFSVGKLPRSASDAERATLLDSLEALIQNGVTVIPDDGSIELVEMAGKSASADLYEKLVAHCSSEIAISLLGQNQTTQSSANRASASAGLEVTKDLRDGDARVISAAINQLIAWVCELNFGNVAAPVFSFWDQREQDQLQAARDKSNYDAGARFTNAYWMRGYGYQEGDLAPEASSAPLAVAQPPGRVALATDANASAPTAFAETSVATDPLQSETDTLMQATAPQWSVMVDQLQTLVDAATDLTSLQQTLVQSYGDLDSAELVKLMAAAMALAELKGMDSARSEVPTVAFAESGAVPDPRIDSVTQDVATLRSALDVLMAREPMIIHNTILPQQVHVHNTLPEQAAPVVNLAAPNITVQPAPVTVNNTHPVQAVQTVERDANDEIVRTVTLYQSNQTKQE
jgi:phage gp29-like protein